MRGRHPQGFGKRLSRHQPGGTCAARRRVHAPDPGNDCQSDDCPGGEAAIGNTAERPGTRRQRSRGDYETAIGCERGATWLPDPSGATATPRHRRIERTPMFQKCFAHAPPRDPQPNATGRGGAFDDVGFDRQEGIAWPSSRGSYFRRDGILGCRASERGIRNLRLPRSCGSCSLSSDPFSRPGPTW